MSVEQRKATVELMESKHIHMCICEYVCIYLLVCMCRPCGALVMIKLIVMIQQFNLEKKRNKKIILTNLHTKRTYVNRRNDFKITITIITYYLLQQKWYKQTITRKLRNLKNFFTENSQHWKMKQIVKHTKAHAH